MTQLNSPIVSPFVKCVNRFYHASLIESKSVNSPNYEDGADSVWRIIGKPMWLGFASMCLVVLGAIQPASPFTLKLPGAWFFGISSQSLLTNPITSPSIGLFIGLVGGYVGLIIFIRAWWSLHKKVTLKPGIPIKYLAYVAILWTLPLLMSPPLFSRDSYSYAAQGEMASRGISPYHYGVSILGANANVYFNQVDRLWQNTPVPYGPLDLSISSLIMDISHHVELISIVLLRLVMGLAGVVLAAACFPIIARKLRVDPARAFVFGILNPITLIHLIGGIHNDGLMVGFLVAGVAMAFSNRPVIGIGLCAIAALIKAPALLGVAFIGWNWPGAGSNYVERFKYLIYSGIISIVVMFLVTWPTGYGWGWVKVLNAPDSVESWLSPITVLAEGVIRLIDGIGLNVSSDLIMVIFRDTGTALSLLIALFLLLNSHKTEWINNLGISFVIIVMLSPVVQPWYLSWGFMILSFTSKGKFRKFAMVLAVISTFFGLPGGKTFVKQLVISSPFLLVPSALILLVVLFAPVIPWYFRVNRVLKDQTGNQVSVVS